MVEHIRLVLSIVFFTLLALFVFFKRKNLTTHKFLFPLLYFSMYRTTWGLASMDAWAKRWNKTLSVLGSIGVVAGFVGMIVIAVSLIHSLVSLFMKPEAAPGVGLVLPIKAKGIFYVPIEYWVICLFIIALVHEFAHGVIARVHDVRVKSSGFAFLSVLIPVIPAAFVEPDERQMKKKTVWQQLSVFAAGPFINVILGFVCLGLLFAVASVESDVLVPAGITITDFVEGNYPAQKAGLEIGDTIIAVDGKEVLSVANLTTELQKRIPNQIVTLSTEEKSIRMTLGQNPDNASLPYMGAYLEQETDYNPDVTQKYGEWLPRVFVWFVGLLTFMFILNLGIGLFNLVPIGPLDGGRMLHITLLHFMEKKKALKIFGYVGSFFILVILISLLFPLVQPLF